MTVDLWGVIKSIAVFDLKAISLVIKDFFSPAIMATTIVILVVTAVIILLFFVSRSSTAVVKFLYVDAILSARSKNFISQKDIESLSEETTLSGVISRLKDTEYFTSIAEKKDLSSIHLALEESMIESITEIKKISPEILNGLFDSYIMFWETKVIKALYASKHSPNVKMSDGLVFPVGSISQNLFTHLVDAKTVQDFSLIMSQTEYKELFIRKFSSIKDFEMAIDSFVLEKFLKKLDSTKMYDKESVIEIVLMKYDITNLLVLIKSHIREDSSEIRNSLVIRTNSYLSKTMELLLQAKNIDELVDRTKNSIYYPALLLALSQFKEKSDSFAFEKELYLVYKKHIIDSEIKYSQGPYPIFSYIAKKEIEKRNLFCVTKGIDSGFSPEQIKEALV